jgi:hypothetical protein
MSDNLVRKLVYDIQNNTHSQHSNQNHFHKSRQVIHFNFLSKCEIFYWILLHEVTLHSQEQAMMSFIENVRITASAIPS